MRPAEPVKVHGDVSDVPAEAVEVEKSRLRDDARQRIAELVAGLKAESIFRVASGRNWPWPGLTFEMRRCSFSMSLRQASMPGQNMTYSFGSLN